MNSFIKNKIFDNGSDKSKIGSVCVENIELNELDIENYLVEYILNEDTLKYIFCNHSPTKRQIKQMYKRFTPPDDIDTEEFISSNSDKKSFYSFLAEGILPIVYKDLYGYSLEYASVDLNQTCSDTNSGIDVCMTNRDSSLFVIGEAKFYKDFQNGMDTIIANFSEDKSLFNKLESLFKHVDNVDELNPIIVKFLNKRECDEIYLKDFLKCKLDFCGFVLHELGNTKIESFGTKETYSKFIITPDNIINKIKVKYPDFSTENITIKIFHLFINSKHDLIYKTIEKAKEYESRIE